MISSVIAHANKFCTAQCIRDRLIDDLSRPGIGYVRYSYHEQDSDSVHIMAMLLKANCSIAPHRSIAGGTNFYIIIEGELELSIGECVQSAKITRILDVQRGVMAVDRLQWRILSNIRDEHCLYLEISPGPFQKDDTRWNWASQNPYK